MERHDKRAVRVLSMTGNFFEDAPGLIIIMLPEQFRDLLAVDGARAAARAASHPGLRPVGLPALLSWVVAAVASTRFYDFRAYGVGRCPSAPAAARSADSRALS